MFRKCLAAVMCVVLACGCASNGFKDATAGEAVIPVGDLSLAQASVAEDLPEESSSSTPQTENNGTTDFEATETPYVENTTAATEVPTSAPVSSEPPADGNFKADIPEADKSWAERFKVKMSIGDCLQGTNGNTEFVLYGYDGNYLSSKPYSKPIYQFYNGVGHMLDTVRHGMFYVDVNGDPIIDEVFERGSAFNRQGYALVEPFGDIGLKIIDKSGAMQTGKFYSALEMYNDDHSLIIAHDLGDTNTFIMDGNLNVILDDIENLYWYTQRSGVELGISSLRIDDIAGNEKAFAFVKDEKIFIYEIATGKITNEFPDAKSFSDFIPQSSDFKLTSVNHYKRQKYPRFSTRPWRD
ncbi:MAG: hypothetical protein LBT59_30910 [Clostridiales bacterium]|jgi:hypothetical protein|nr:hypothetical protein [Clostridiales bacterium]